MSRHLETEIEKLKKAILSLTAVAEDRVQKAVRSLEERNPDLAREVIDGDAEIDQAEVDIEEECLKILALHQPVAVDLRFIIAVLHINNNMERVGDLAVNMAERTLFLCTQEPVPIPFDLAGMHRKALAMLGHSLDALMRMDANLARQVRAADDEVDEMNREMYAKVSESARRNPEHIEILLSYLSASRHLERVADHATNIAEEVIYLIEGDIVRHKPALPEGLEASRHETVRPPQSKH
jgi:phosphate transport system protein